MKMSVLVGTSWNSALRDAVKTSCNWRRCKRLQPTVGLVHVLVCSPTRGDPEGHPVLYLARHSFENVLVCRADRVHVASQRGRASEA